MSGHGFHVHGPHDHAVEHGAESGDSLAGRVAVMTAILSTVGAVCSYQGGATQNEAMLHKNEAVLKKTEAADHWAWYQAKSIKGTALELALASAPPDRAEGIKAQIEKTAKDKLEIKAKADKLEEEAKAENEKSEAAMHPHHRLAQALTLIQISISLASITVLTRKRWLFYGALATAAGGAGLWISSLLIH